MTASGNNRFEDFFADGAYVALKNLLYNYRLRKRAVKECLSRRAEGVILEVGSGLSPVVPSSLGQVVYSDLSFPALKALRETRTGDFVVADAAHLPFKSAAFAHVVCSEVLEHLSDDRQALREMVAVLKQGGSQILTFPHRRGYFAVDDRFVHHLRRYDLSDMEERLMEAGLELVEVRKVLGPLEKVTMILVVSAASLWGRLKKPSDDGKIQGGAAGQSDLWRFIVPPFRIFNLLFCLPVWLDARLAPRFLSAVLLTRSVKR